MNNRTLIFRTIVYYLKRNALLAAGIAISTAVLTGSLIVGDSVSYSLNKIVDNRLGNITHSLDAGDRFFTIALAEKLSGKMETNAAPVLKTDGIAVVGGGQIRLPGIQVLGVNSGFDQMAGTDSLYSNLKGYQVIISQRLAEKLAIEKGDEILLRMEKASLVPVNAPFVSDAENTVSTRVVIADIVGIDALGTFNLKNSQTAPLNLFISLDRLTELMDIGNRANLLLFGDENLNGEFISKTIAENWSVADIGLNFSYDDQKGLVEVKSDRVFIDPNIAGAIEQTERNVRPVLTYFVNSLSHNELITPYSFVSTLPDSILKPGKVIVNSWLAEDLDLKVDDKLLIRYYVVGPLRSLETREREFIVNSVVPITGIYGDEGLMPDIPGLSDAGNCRDWDTGVPINLDSIRDKDEAYWTKYKGTPKAFISNSVAEEIWQNRFGKYTSFRMDASIESLPKIHQEILNNVDPASIGFKIESVRRQAGYAASNGVDFSQLFAGLSFFLLVGAILLSVMLFRLNLDERKEQIKTLISMGIAKRRVQKLLLAEGLLIAFTGILIGLVIAVFYNKLIFKALNGIWMDIVRTEMLVTRVRISTLFAGFVASGIISGFAVFIPLRRFLKIQTRRHVRTGSLQIGSRVQKGLLILSAVLLFVALAIVVLQFLQGNVVNAGLFFLAGGLLLIAGIIFSFSFLLRVKSGSFAVKSIASLGVKNTIRNTTRSLIIVVLFSIGTFLVISTGSNRKDLFANAGEKSSGTGGFLFYAETTVPVLQDLRDKDVRFRYGLTEGYDFIQLRVADGDDASCLNLNRITTPRILGVDPEKLSGRFTFVTSTDMLNENDPWSSLGQALDGELIPAIADETVIKWGLGMSVGDTLLYTDAKGKEMKLLLVGGLAPSVFQGNVLISEERFLNRYPENSGTQVFLVEGPMDDTTSIMNEVQRGFRDLGLTMEYAPARLAKFNSINNTYLSIFLIMGALGLLLGTVGLAVVLARSVLERRNEIAIFRALGFGLKKIRWMIAGEYFALLAFGTFIGSLSAIIATLPSLLSENSDISIGFILLIVALLLLNGIFWIYIISLMILKKREIVFSLRNE